MPLLPTPTPHPPSLDNDLLVDAEQDYDVSGISFTRLALPAMAQEFLSSVCIIQKLYTQLCVLHNALPKHEKNKQDFSFLSISSATP